MAKEKVEKEEVIENKPKKMVEVEESVLNDLIKRVETLSKDQNTLFQAADKQRLAKVYEGAGQSLVKQVKVSYFSDIDKYIVGWKMVKNSSEIMPHTGKWVEDQRVIVIFDDGEMSEEMQLVDFYRKVNLNKKKADIISQTQKFDEKTKSSINILEVEFENGKKLLIDSRFIN